MPYWSPLFIYFTFISADDIQKLWTNLWENFRKCIKKREQRTRSGAGSSKLPTCNYFTELSFLTDTLKNKPTDSNLDRAIRFGKENTTPRSEESSDVDFTPKRTMKRNRDVNRATNNTQQQQPSMLDLAIVETLKSSKKEVSEEPKEKDCNVLFCLSLVDTLKALSPRENSLAELKIQQVLFEIEHGD